MDYDTDTLTNASRNREASRKLFQQLEQHNQLFHRPFVFPQVSQSVWSSSSSSSSSSVMLHRSPSGALRKIRQRREEMSQQRLQQQIAQPASSSSTEALNDFGYRSLVDSNSYRSILDDSMTYRSEIGGSSEDDYSGSPQSRVPINTFAKPEPPRRTLAALDHSNFGNSPEKFSPTVNEHSVEASLPVKPTVEVHPMPAPRTTPIHSLKKHIIPPPIPKKPERLRKMMEQHSADYQERLFGEEETLSIVSASPNENELPSSKHSVFTAETSIDSVEESKACCSKPCSSTEALDRLHTSFHVRAIEEKFDGARSSAIELDADELKELEKRRLISINKLTKKVGERTADLGCIEEEKEAAIVTIQSFLHNHPTWMRIEREIQQRAHLIELEGVARVRLQQIGNLNKEHSDALQSRVNYWNDKIKDVRYLAVFVSRRIQQIEEEIADFLDAETFSNYKKCMDLLIELEAEKTETAEKLATVQKQIEQLQNIKPVQHTRSEA